MVQLLHNDNFSLFFRLLDMLHKGKSFPTSGTSDSCELKKPPSYGDSPQVDVSGNKVSSLDDLMHSLWELLMILPTNIELRRRLESFEKEEGGDQTAHWCKIISTDSMFKLLYVLHIIDSLGSCNYGLFKRGSKGDVSSDSEDSSSDNEHTLAGPGEPLSWVRRFIRFGGLKHLYDRLMSDSLAVDKSSDDWKLGCVGYLLKLLTRFGCVQLSREEKDENDAKRRRQDSKQKRQVFRARYKSIDGDNVILIRSFNQVCLTYTALPLVLYGTALLSAP